MVAKQKFVKLLCSPCRVQAAFGGDDRFHFVSRFLRAVLRSTMAVGETLESVTLEAVDPLGNGELPGLRQDGKLLSLFHLGFSFPGHIPPL